MIQQIEELDKNNKENLRTEAQEEIQRVVNMLKLLNAKEVAKDIMYAHQRMSEYKDKPGKQLARILSKGEANKNNAIVDTRLDWALVGCIHTDQTQIGFLRNRQMSNNIRRVINLIDYINQSCESTLYYLEDAEKPLIEWSGGL